MSNPSDFSLQHTTSGELARNHDSVVRLATIDREEGAKRVVLKFPNLRAKDTLEALFRARDAGRRLTELQHQHIVSASEVGVVEGHICLVTPHIVGLDLLEWLEILSEAQVRMPTSVVVEILRASASALDAALNRPVMGKNEPLGIMHRDLKPSNIMVDQHGDVKLIDFRAGLSSLQGRHAKMRLLHSGLIRYLSPSRRAGHRSTSLDDVYALGLIAIELLRGRWLRRLRTDNPAHDRYFAQLVATLENIQFRSDATDNVLRTLLLRMVAFDPTARPTADQIQQICRRISPDAVGPSMAEFMRDRGSPIIEPTPPLASLRLPIRIYPEQPLDLPTSKIPLFPDEADENPYRLEWQETDAGWIEITINQENELQNVDREADETEKAIRSLRPGATLSNRPEISPMKDKSRSHRTWSEDPTALFRAAVIIGALGLISLAIGIGLIILSTL